MRREVYVAATSDHLHPAGQEDQEKARPGGQLCLVQGRRSDAPFFSSPRTDLIIGEMMFPIADRVPGQAEINLPSC